MQTLLVTGASGLLGNAACRGAVGKFHVSGVFFKHKVDISGVEMFAADLSTKEGVAAIDSRKPNVIIHCAAMTSVDACEERPEEAYRHNVVAAKNVAEAARRCGAYLVHISTESVFDGERGQYTEKDTPRPLNVYARTKLEAESAVLNLVPEAAVVRTTIYGWNAVGKQSLAEWILAKLRAGEEVPGFKDVYFSPILANDLADILFLLCERKPQGILNISGSQACSKYEFAMHLAEAYGFNRERLRPTKAASANFKARRPLNVSLDVTKAQELLRVFFPDLGTGLKRFKAIEDMGARHAQ